MPEARYEILALGLANSWGLLHHLDLPSQVLSNEFHYFSIVPSSSGGAVAQGPELELWSLQETPASPSREL